MSSTSPDIGPPPPDNLDVVVRGQTLTAAVKSLPGDTKVAFTFMRAGVPETRFTRPEAKALVKALGEILNVHPNYGTRNPIY